MKLKFLTTSLCFLIKKLISSFLPGITFDDLIVLPGEINFGVGEVDLRTKLTRNISIQSPLCSAAMDTVTEYDMAIGMALHGGVGILHCNMSAEDQADMVRTVKTYENGFILSPAVLSPDHKVSDIDELYSEKKISGVPVTIDGKMGSKLIGLVSKRDIDFVTDRRIRLQDVMTPLSELITGTYPLSIEEANRILRESKKGYLPIVDEAGNLRALTTRTDMKKNRDFPLASKDAAGKLLVGAAVKSSAKDVVDRDRIRILVGAGCDIILLDSQNGDNRTQIEMIQEIKRNYPGVEVIAGNVTRTSQAKALLEAGADALRIGMGVGSVATTQIVKAVGRAQLSAVYHCAKIAKDYGVPVIADGGIKNTGCLIKSLALGASCAMLGSLLAGVAECPGDYFYRDGTRLKSYRGNFSSAPAYEAKTSPPSPGSPRSNHRKGASAMSTFSEPSVWIPSGVAGAVVDKGPLSRYIPYLCQSIRHGLQDMGTASLNEMWRQMYTGELRFELRSSSAQKEGGVHDLHSFQQRLYA